MVLATTLPVEKEATLDKRLNLKDLSIKRDLPTIKNILMTICTFLIMGCSGNQTLHSHQYDPNELTQKNPRDGGDGGSGVYSPGADGNEDGCIGGNGGDGLYAPGKKCPKTHPNKDH